MSYEGGKFPGWVSENYMAMGRLCKWVYSYFDCVAEDTKYDPGYMYSV